MRDSTSKLRVVREADGVIVGELGNLCLVVWREAVTPSRFQAQREGLSEIASRHPEGIGLLCVVETTSKPPDDKLRRASADMVKEHERSLRAIACVVEGTGFVSSLARSALSAIALLLGARPFALRVLADVGSAATWIAPNVGGSDPGEVSAAIASLRERLSRSPA